MNVRVKVGRHAGEIRDVEQSAAKAMLADGRATDPRFEELPAANLAAEVKIPVASPRVAPSARGRK